MPRAPFPAFDIDPQDPAPDGLPCGPVTAPKRAARRAPVSIGQVIQGMTPAKPAPVIQLSDELKQLYDWLGTDCRADVDGLITDLQDTDPALLKELLPDRIRICSKYDRESLKPERAARRAELEAEQARRDLRNAPISIYPLMGIQAARRASRMGGGWRAYALGKALDKTGVGRVKRDDLKAYALELGVNVRTWDRWVNEARKNDLLIDIQKGDDWYFILPAAGPAGLAMGLETIGPRKATIAAGALIGKGWKARVFSAWEHDKQISRETIQKTINVPLSTQRLRDAQADTYKRKNYAKSKMTGDKLTGIKEYSKHKAPFVFRDGFIGWRLPDTRLSSCASKGSKGRARKANRFIRNAKPQKGLSIMRQALTDGELRTEAKAARRDWVRLFNHNETQRKATERRISKRDLYVLEIYQEASQAKSGAVIWNHCPLNGD